MIRPPAAGVATWTALGCGLTGGALFAFSSFVMPALSDLPPQAGIAAMQSINRQAVTAPFMTAVFLPAAACAYLAARGWRHRSQPGSRRLLSGAALYLVGTIGVTVAANVPLNDALAVTPSDAADAARDWNHYVTAWSLWNHVRVASALGAAALIAGSASS